MHRGYRLYLEDIVNASEKIQRFIGSLTFNEFLNDEKTYDAVVRNFEIIGEAARNSHPSVEWKKVYLFRNVLTHEYFGVDSRLLWDIIQNRLPELKAKIREILDSEAR